MKNRFGFLTNKPMLPAGKILKLNTINAKIFYSEVYTGKLVSLCKTPEGVAAYFTVLAAVCLVLPWAAPVRAIRSESYAFGFSNSMFLACVLSLLIAPAWIIGRFCAESKMEPHAQSRASESYFLDKPASIAAKTIILATTVFLLLISRNMTGYVEAEYFLLRAVLIEAGYMPYRDFEYAYGPALIYSIVFLKWLGLNIGFAQWLLVVGETLTGYACLHYIARSVMGAKSDAAVTISIALCVATCLAMDRAGQNYTFFRFAAVMALVCYIIKNLSPETWPKTPLLSGPIFLIGWAISPEVGAAGGLTFAIMSTLLTKSKLTASFYSIASLTAVGWLIPWVLPSASTLLQFSMGGNNFPAFPAPHIIILLGAIFVSTLHVSSRLLNEHRTDHALFIFSICMLPGALGRCDYGHVIFYGYGFFMLATKYIFERAKSTVAYKHFAHSVGLVFFALSLAAQTDMLLPAASALAKNLTEFVTPSEMYNVISRLPEKYHEKAIYVISEPRTRSFKRSDKRPVIVAPRSDFLNLENVDIPYAVTLQNVKTRKSFNQLAAELRGRDVWIKKETISQTCSAFKPDNRELSRLFLFPVNLFPQRNYKNVSENLCDDANAAILLYDGGKFGMSLYRFR